jgi:hypothetical protein
MAVGNEKAKSVILTANREFRATAVNMLNNLAFASEKLSASSIDEIRVQVARDRTLVNIIIDAAGMSDPEFGHLVEKWDEILKGKEARALIFYQESQKALMEKHQAVTSTWAHSTIKPLPQAKPHYVECFYSARKQGSSAFPGAPAVKPSETAAKPAPAQAAPAAAQQKNLSFFEASGHVRDTIDSLNKIIKDRSAVADLAKVGQRFNGIIGGFAFFGDKPGYRELVHLADWIDTVAREYSVPGQRKEATEQHVNFVMDAAKCSYLMLKELRETEKITDDTNNKFNQCKKAFDLINDIKKKSKNDQVDVDKLLEEAQKQAS